MHENQTTPLKEDRPVRQSEVVSRSIHRSSLRWGLAVAALWGLLGVLIFQTRAAHNLEKKIALPIEFALRTKMKHDPIISDRLKILLLEDNTFSSLQRADLTLEEWGDLLKNIANQRVSAIIIDKIFGALEDPNHQADRVFAELKTLKTPIYSGTFTSPTTIQGRYELNTVRDLYQISHYTDGQTQATLPPLADNRNQRVYAGTKRHQEVFIASHINYPGDNLVAPMIRLSDTTVLPHIGLSASTETLFKNGKLYVNGQKVPVNPDGYFIPNFLTTIELYSPKRTRPLQHTLKYVAKGVPYSFVSPNDLVLIVPSAFTGGTDFKVTPQGNVPGGFILAAVINSAITGQWIQSVGYEWYFIVLVTAIGTAIALLRGITLWIMIFVTPVMIAGGSLAAFIYSGQHYPWPIYVMQIFTTSVLVFTQRSRFETKREQAFIETENEYLVAWKEQKRLEKEKAEAAEIAAAFIPEPFPTNFGPYQVSGFHSCFDAASGDWYFFEQSASGRFFHFVMCDITGHGVQAAIVVSTCRTVLSMFKMSQPELFETRDFVQIFATRVNQVLCSQGQKRHSTTLAGIVFEPEKCCISYITCANPFPLVFNAASSHGTTPARPKALVSRNAILGIEADSEFKYKEHPFSAGDELVVYTDGIQVQGTPRIIANYIAQRESQHLTPKDCVKMTWDEHHEREGFYPEDDVSLVFFKHQDPLNP